jgi:hypothetical protein
VNIFLNSHSGRTGGFRHAVAVDRKRAFGLFGQSLPIAPEPASICRSADSSVAHRQTGTLMLKHILLLVSSSLLCDAALAQPQPVARMDQATVDKLREAQKLHYRATGLPPGLSIDPDSGVISGDVDRIASCKLGNVFDVDILFNNAAGINGREEIRINLTNSATTSGATKALQNCAKPDAPLKVEVSRR